MFHFSRVRPKLFSKTFPFAVLMWQKNPGPRRFNTTFDASKTVMTTPFEMQLFANRVTIFTKSSILDGTFITLLKAL